MSLPPSFSQSFFRKLALYAREFKMSRATFAAQAIEHYAAELRKQETFPVQTLGSEKADKYADLISKVSKSWWAKVSPEKKRNAPARPLRPAGQKRVKNHRKNNARILPVLRRSASANPSAAANARRLVLKRIALFVA